MLGIENKPDADSLSTVIFLSSSISGIDISNGNFISAGVVLAILGLLYFRSKKPYKDPQKSAVLIKKGA